MAQEVAVKSYYHELRDKNWIDTNQTCCLGVEFFLSHLLFNKDLSKVVYSKEDMCFRKRVEVLGKGDVHGQSFSFLNLDLPFASYTPSGNYEPDDRFASMNAAAAVKGHMQPDTGVILKNMPVKVKYSCIAFYGRRDDVNVASQLLYWEQNPKWPIYFIVHHQIAEQPLDIPVFMEIDSVDSNFDFQEKKWLEESKIFPIKIDLTIRSYQTLIETTSEAGMLLPLRWSGLYGYNNQGEIYLTQNSLLMWGDDKFSHEALETELKHNPSYLETSFNEWEEIIDRKEPIAQLGNRGALLDYKIKDDPSDEDLALLAEQSLHRVNVTVEEAVKGYFNDDSTCVLQEFRIEDETDTTLKIKWILSDVAKKSFNRVTIYCPGLIHWFTESPIMEEFLVEDLHPHSKYEFTVVASGGWGEKTYRLIGETTGTPTIGNGSRLLNNLVGKTFQNTTFTNRNH